MRGVFHSHVLGFVLILTNAAVCSDSVQALVSAVSLGHDLKRLFTLLVYVLENMGVNARLTANKKEIKKALNQHTCIYLNFESGWSRLLFSPTDTTAHSLQGTLTL